MEKKEPKVRYSDEELEEFKALILEKLEQAKSNLETLQANLSGGEHSTDDTAPTFKVLEDGYATQSFLGDESAGLAANAVGLVFDTHQCKFKVVNVLFLTGG